MDQLWRDYGSLVAPAAAIINGFIAVVIAQFFKDHPIAKFILVCAAFMFGAAAIGATFYSQHEVIVAKATENSRRIMIREKIGEFISEGNSIMNECRLIDKPVPKAAAYNWERSVENYLLSQMGNSYVIRFKDTTGIYPLTLPGADSDHISVWYEIYTRVFRLEQISQQLPN